MNQEDNLLFQGSLMHFASEPEASLNYQNSVANAVAELMVIRESAENISINLAYDYCERLYNLEVKIA